MGELCSGKRCSMRIVLVAFTALAVSGCVSSPYVGTPYDRASAGVTSIGMAEDSVPEKAIALEAVSAGLQFGLVGALIDSGIQASRQDALNDALLTVQYDAETQLEIYLAERLRDMGYSVSMLPGEPRETREYIKTYPLGDRPVDAYLDVVVREYGYHSAGASLPFRPYADATVRLVDAESGSILMENAIVYNGMNPSEGVITLSPNPEYAFTSREDLLGDPNRTAAGIQDALNRIADTTAQFLR